MGRRSSKAGLRRCTGNTIRLPGGHPSLEKYQNYSYFITEARNMDKDQTRQFSDLMKYMPTADGFVEYSMNKKKRWELPRVIKNKLLEESDNNGLLMRVTEHTLHVGQAIDEHRKSCSAYYTNNGPVTEKVSHSEMNMNSAMQAYSETDHMNKQERREYKRFMRNSISSTDESDEEDDSPRYNCHIVHGAATDGRLHKDLSTRGILLTRSKRSNMVGGCSKLSRFRLLDEDYDTGYDVEDSGTDEASHCRPETMTVQLSDCIVSSTKAKKKAKLAKAGWELIEIDETHGPLN